MKYTEYKETRGKELNKLPMAFAFSNAQFVEAMKKLRLEPTDTDKVLKMGLGGIMRKDEVYLYRDHNKQWNAKFKELLNDDDFIVDMFHYELGNHEYIITYEDEDTLNACGFTVKEVYENERLNRLYKKARDRYLAWYKEKKY